MNRKGITPVIAIVILLMITVAGAGAAYVWITNIQKQIGEDTETRLETKLEILQTECNAETANLDLIIINSGKRTVDMVPFDVLVYDSAGKVSSITRVGVNETHLSDSDKWKLAQRPGGYTDEVTITMSDDFEDGEYYSSILLRFREPLNYEVESSCQAN